MSGVLAVDPGSAQSAWAHVGGLLGGDDITLRAFGIVPNAELLQLLRTAYRDVDAVVVEKIESYGMAVGAEVFETVWWSGRFAQVARDASFRTTVERLTRRAVKLHLCGSAKAKDANIRQALIDKYGGDSAYKGTKAAPGPLHGVSKDVWAALAVGVTWVEAQQVERDLRAAADA